MRSKRHYVLEAWNKYREHCVPPAAGLEQVEYLKMTFFGGASAMFFSMIGNMSEGGDVEDSDMQMIDDLHDELKEFALAKKREEQKT